MSDEVDSGDISSFPIPERHEEDVLAELSKLSTLLVDTLMENDEFQTYATDYSEAFAEQMGEIAAMLLSSKARRYEASIHRGYSDAIEALDDMDVIQE